MRPTRITASVLTAALVFTIQVAARAETGKTDDPSNKTAPSKATKGHKSPDKASDTAVAPDNTGTNKRDRKSGEKTVDQQTNDKSDVDLAADIRRAVVKDDTLSTNAHNLKIIVEDGKVTLKGPVASKEERIAVEKKASAIAGRRKVINELAVAP